MKRIKRPRLKDTIYQKLNKFTNAIIFTVTGVGLADMSFGLHISDLFTKDELRVAAITIGSLKFIVKYLEPKKPNTDDQN
jgi:hypothetical protein